MKQSLYVCWLHLLDTLWAFVTQSMTFFQSIHFLRTCRCTLKIDLQSWFKKWDMISDKKKSVDWRCCWNNKTFKEHGILSSYLKTTDYYQVNCLTISLQDMDRTCCKAVVMKLEISTVKICTFIKFDEVISPHKSMTFQRLLYKYPLMTTQNGADDGGLSGRAFHRLCCKWKLTSLLPLTKKKRCKYKKSSVNVKATADPVFQRF